MSSPSKQPVPQIPAEYDDLYMENGPYASQRDFSSCINKQMKVRRSGLALTRNSYMINCKRVQPIEGLMVRTVVLFAAA